MKKPPGIYKYLIYALFVLSFAGYFVISYDNPRISYIQLFTLFFILFAISCLFIYLSKQWRNISIFIAIAILFRLIFIVAIPALSDDYIRFVWDGQLLAHGVNPFTILPKDFILMPQAANIPLVSELYPQIKPLQLNNYTCYPPFNQFFFLVGALIFNHSILGNIMVMRLFIIAAEIGTIYIGLRLLRVLKLPEKNILWYALNPMIIIEFSGNLHFEGILLFFLVLALYLVAKNKPECGSAALALSASLKLVPLLFLPQFYKQFSFKKLLLFYSIFAVVFLALFSPVFFINYQDTFFRSLKLYFNDFEGNSSIYILMREICYKMQWDNYVPFAGKILSFISLVTILMISFLRNNKEIKTLIQSMLFAITCYYFLARAIHPWYISPLLLLSVFTGYRYAYVWSLMMILSYYTYYTPLYEENLGLTLIIYITVYGYFGYEIFKKRNKVQIDTEKVVLN